MQKRRHKELLSIFVAVLALHVALVWLLIENSHISAPATSAAVFELLFIPPVSTVAPLPTETPLAARKVREAVAPRANTPTIAAPVTTVPAPLPDWNAELDRAANASIDKQSQPKARDFGFPETQPAPSPKQEKFAWDYAATHRVENLPQGEILVHLNDNCVLVMIPLPFIGCALGKRQPNGQLLEHMREPNSASGTSAAP